MSSDECVKVLYYNQTMLRIQIAFALIEFLALLAFIYYVWIYFKNKNQAGE